MNVFNARIQALETWRSKCLNVWWLCWSDVYHLLPCHMLHQIQNSVHHQCLLTSLLYHCTHTFLTFHTLYMWMSCKSLLHSTLEASRAYSEKRLAMFWLLIQSSHLKWKHLSINNEMKCFAIVTIKLQGITYITSTKWWNVYLTDKLHL